MIYFRFSRKKTFKSLLKPQNYLLFKKKIPLKKEVQMTVDRLLWGPTIFTCFETCCFTGALNSVDWDECQHQKGGQQNGAFHHSNKNEKKG